MDDVDTPGSPGSPLSEIDSDDVESVKFNNRSRSSSRLSNVSAASSNMSAEGTPAPVDAPPAKRRKTGASAYDHATPQSGSTAIPPRSPTGSISSDTSASVPNSPSFANLPTTHPLSTAYAAAQANPENPEQADYIQVTRCLWEDCPTPEQGNMDNLVQHINDVHIVPRQKKYYCGWAGCTRKGITHNSAYALKAHMRSHTKEKPFFCVLPECDRSFTRSDALAKHMRTVHDTEALRPSDPVPKHHPSNTNGTNAAANSAMTKANGAVANAMSGVKRIKLIMNNSNTNGEKKLFSSSTFLGDLPPLPTRYTAQLRNIPISDKDIISDPENPDIVDAIDIDSMPFQLPVPPGYYPPEMEADMDEEELALPPSQYFRLLRRQIHWAEEENLRLDEELAELRGTVEDAQGARIKRNGGDEKGGDDNRRWQWKVTEGILDRLMEAKVGRVKESVGVHHDESEEGRTPFEMVKALEGQVREAVQASGEGTRVKDEVQT